MTSSFRCCVIDMQPSQAWGSAPHYPRTQAYDIPGCSQYSSSCTGGRGCPEQPKASNAMFWHWIETDHIYHNSVACMLQRSSASQQGGNTISSTENPKFPMDSTKLAVINSHRDGYLNTQYTPCHTPFPSSLTNR